MQRSDHPCPFGAGVGAATRRPYPLLLPLTHSCWASSTQRLACSKSDWSVLGELHSVLLLACSLQQTVTC